MNLDINPGFKLQRLLLEMIPNDAVTKYDLIDSSYFVTKVDSILDTNGDFTDLIYRSTINYLVRRLVTTAVYVQRETAGLDESIFIIQLRKSLQYNFKFDSAYVERILILLIECLKVIDKDLKTAKKQIIKREALKNGITNCYICGKAVSYEKVNEHDAVEIEHHWPRSLGGSSADDNLVIACHKCNRDKRAHIDSSDFHYEYIDNFKNHIENVEKLAIWSKTNYCCSVCNQPATKVGQLTLARTNEKDTWHYLNLSPYCSTHLPSSI